MATADSDLRPPSFPPGMLAGHLFVATRTRSRTSFAHIWPHLSLATVSTS